MSKVFSRLIMFISFCIEMEVMCLEMPYLIAWEIFYVYLLREILYNDRNCISHKKQ